MSRIRVILTFTLLIYFCSALKVDDSIHYTFKFESDLENKLREDLIEQNDKLEQIKLKSKNDENFVCFIPITNDQPSQELNDYSGPTPSDILTPLFNENVCSLRVEAYWSYELCHGRYIMQFHEEKGAMTGRTEYYLGNLNIDKSVIEIDFKHPPRTRIGSEDLPYFPIKYTQGTICELTDKPRVTTVKYVCNEYTRTQIYSVYEVSTCAYEVIVLTKLICQHPSFKPPKKNVFDITCYNSEDKDDARPIALAELEALHSDTFKREYTLTHDYRAVTPEEIKEEEEEFKLRIKKPEDLKKLGGVKQGEAPETLANNKRIVQQTVNRILTGKECISGGGEGWWLYEFCFGRSVIQYHVEPNNDRIEILLGEFNSAIHKAWIETNRELHQPKKRNGQIVQVNYMYSRGAVCEASKIHRNVEVRIHCKSVGASALAITMYLEEPRTCNYILNIESERFCEPLQYADEYGIIHLDSSTEADDILI